MRRAAWLGAAVGLGLAAWLLHSYGLGRILGLLARAGWSGFAAVVAFHLVQLVASAAGWWAIAAAATPRPSLSAFILLRWIREAVNNLLPGAQIGGEFVASRLLRRRGVPLAWAIAGTVADLTLEMVTQIGFTVLGLALLVDSVGLLGSASGGLVDSVVGGLIVAALLVAGFIGAQWLGAGSLVERGLLWLGRAAGWAGAADMEGLHAALVGCYRVPSRVAVAAAAHMLSWLLGGVEVCLILRFLGHGVGVGPGLVIEGIGQALKAAGFAVPGALGVQEGGYVVICQAYGLSPEVAIALSLMKRLREVALGVPGLLAWQRLEARPSARREATTGTAS